MSPPTPRPPTPRAVTEPGKLIFHQTLGILKPFCARVSAEFKELRINLNQTDYDPSEPNWQTLTAFMFY